MVAVVADEGGFALAELAVELHDRLDPVNLTQHIQCFRRVEERVQRHVEQPAAVVVAQHGFQLRELRLRIELEGLHLEFDAA